MPEVDGEWTSSGLDDSDVVSALPPTDEDSLTTPDSGTGEKTSSEKGSDTGDDSNEDERILAGQRYLAAQQEDVDARIGVPSNAPTITTNPNRLNKMFGEDTGHVPDNPMNRAMFRLTGARER